LAAVEEVARGLWPANSIVRIVSVSEVPRPVTAWELATPPNAFGEWERTLEERAQAHTTRALARFGEVAESPLEVITKTLKGDPKTAILEEAEQWRADLIVLGTHGYNALERLWLGSVSRAVVSHAECSVEIVRRRGNQGITGGAMKILLAVDGSESSDAAVSELIVRPWPLGSEVRIISVVHLPLTPSPEAWSASESFYAELEKIGREQAQAAIDAATARLRESNSAREPGWTLTSTITIGHPEEAIIETAKKWEANLILMGSHGYHGFKRFLLGSVSQAVASHAPCSVEIVRRPAKS
ncbi:MAG TPA: universal stress protein, partial [Blastocatellia bacterium]|nr:universal stress protein [Blastocatellia bacterium]